MIDNRIALKKGDIVNFPNNKEIHISEEVGRGANCIVYNAIYWDNIKVKHRIRVKECYPNYLLIERKPDNKLIPFQNNNEKFKSAKQDFINTYERNANIRNTIGFTNSTINATDIIYCNNTIYIIMALDEGLDYRKFEDKSLKDLFKHVKSLAKLIQKYHENGYLHLDIKPENILVLPETNEHILLFDFDSVISIKELRKNSKFRLSFSDGFSAPEQMQGKFNKIGNHTDIYSIGALVFYKLFNRKPTSDDCKISSVFNFENMRYPIDKYQPKLVKKLDTFFRKTLSVSIVPRWHNMQQVIDQLDELIKLSDMDQMFLIDSFQYNSACFVGRNKEIEELDNILTNNQLVFISGIGGIGKTELIKQYAKKYRKKYDTILFSVFEKNIEMLVCDEIMINKIDKDKNESDDDYFNRKIKIIKQVATSNDLIIIDNFDVDTDDKLEILFSCPCKFIITTRMDFRDYNYEQINVGKIDDLNDILNLFYTYNDIEYSDDENIFIKNLIEFVDHHTMTVELIAKYLRNSSELPSDLYKRFLEKEGVTNTDEINIKQRKDRRLRSDSVNSHLKTLFDVSQFDDIEKEVISSLSLFAGIRINKFRFINTCKIENIDKKLDLLIRNGWIEYNNISDKISLHQVIQDLIYMTLNPDATKCPSIVKGILEYVSEDVANYSESKIRQKVFDIFMERLSGDNISYANLCLKHGKETELDKAEKICLKYGTSEAFDILQKIYRKRIRITSECNDMFETEMDLDDYLSRQLTIMGEMLKKVTLFCKKSSQNPDYIVKEYIEAGCELDNIFSQKLWLLPDKQTNEMDNIYLKIIDMFDIATDLLPLTSFTALEKEKFYKKIEDFYSGEDLCAVYKNDYFSDVEKAYKYQKIIEKIREDSIGAANNKEYIHDVSCNALAEKFMKEGKYQEAIKYYKKAYDEEDEMYDIAMQNISNVYFQMGNINKSIAYLEQVLDNDKKLENKPDAFFSYSCYICVNLIKKLIINKEFSRAQKYAKELIHYMMPNILEVDNSYSVTYVLAGYYFLFKLETNEYNKNKFWQKCLKYYDMLGSNVINEDIYEFILEYLDKENKSYKNIFNIIDRIDKWNGTIIKEKIINKSLEKYHNKKDFIKYEIEFLLRLAVISNEYPYNNIKDGLKNCEKAQKCYDKYKLQDEYIQSLIYKTKAELMSNDNEYEYDEINDIKKRCNFKMLAEYQISNTVCNEEKQIEIWKSTADEYKYTDNYQMEAICLEQAIEILKPILNQYEFSKFEYNYWYIIGSLIEAYINLKKFNAAYTVICELYEETIYYVTEKNNSESINELVWKLKHIADYYVKVSKILDAVKTYLLAIYLLLINKSHISIDTFNTNTGKDINLLCDKIYEQLSNEIDAKMVDTLIELKDELLKYKDISSIGIDKYKLIISKISNDYEQQEIEFKENKKL